MRVERIDAADFSLIWPLVQAAFSDARTYPYNPQADIEEARGIWCSADKRTYAAWVNETVVGTCYIRPNQPCLGSHICNAGFIISSAHAGLGYGKVLGRWALEEAVRLGYEAMQFNWVVADNKASLHIWDQLGFQIVGTVPNAFKGLDGRYQDALILYKALVV